MPDVELFAEMRKCELLYDPVSKQLVFEKLRQCSPKDKFVERLESLKPDEKVFLKKSECEEIGEGLSCFSLFNEEDRRSWIRCALWQESTDAGRSGRDHTNGLYLLRVHPRSTFCLTDLPDEQPDGNPTEESETVAVKTFPSSTADCTALRSCSGVVRSAY